MKVTIVLCSYNGEKYIEKQMESLINQSKLPDEVIICDDASTDDTLQIVQRFIERNHLCNWIILKKMTNLGWKRNFFESFKIASGDIIFSCDQDDIWNRDKIEKMSAIFENSQVNVLFSKYRIFFEKDKIYKMSKWETIGQRLDKFAMLLNCKKQSNKIKRIKVNKRFMKVFPGCVMCIRKKYFEKIEVFWKSNYGHDAFMKFYSTIDNSCFLYDYFSIQWRQYSGSTSRPKIRVKEVRLNELKEELSVLFDLKEYSCIVRNARIFDKLIYINRLRYKFIISKNIFIWILLFFNIAYYTNKRAYFTDFLYTFKKIN